VEGASIVRTHRVVLPTVLAHRADLVRRARNLQLLQTGPAPD
jgi:hypothetical protein